MLPVSQVKTKSVVLSNVKLRGLTVNVGVKGITEIRRKAGHEITYHLKQYDPSEIIIPTNVESFLLRLTIKLYHYKRNSNF